jgi:apolipoprotein N-acyltransferase
MPPKRPTIKPTLPTAVFLAPRLTGALGTVLLALGSGILMGCTPAPINAWMFAWIALAPLWVLITQPTAAVPLRCALAWGIGYHGLALSWIRDLHPLTWMGVPWLASIAITGFCWVFITLWGAGSVMLWAWLLRQIFVTDRLQLGLSGWSAAYRLPALRILVGTTLWCSFEALWAQGVLCWTSLSYTQSPHNLPILHLGQLSGPLMVTAAIVVFNAVLAEAWMQRNLREGKARQFLNFNLAFLVALHLLGFGLYNQPLADSPEAGFKVGIVQGNIPTRIKLFDQGLRLSIDRFVAGYESLVDQGVDAVLTPEGSLPWLWIDRPNQNPFYRAVVERGVPAWIGTVGLRQGRITQTLFSLDGMGEVVGRYDKMKLVPLGEYIPFESVVGGVIGRLSPVGASMVPGAVNQQVETPFGQAIVGICYDSAFSDLFRRQAATGGLFVLTASNNDPYGRAMMAQHHAQDVMRAIETNRWTVRATNTGLSGVVDPHGNTAWLSGFRTYETHAHTIYHRQTQTPYVRWGNWLTPLLWLLSIGALLRVRLTYSRSAL